MSADAEAEVRAAAADLVAAFAAHDTDRYFAAIAEDATFLFPTHPGLLATRAAYEAAWRAWELDGFRVLGCRTDDTEVRVVADGLALLTHRVHTRLAAKDAADGEEVRERETVVFRRFSDGRWLVVHEHLSPEP
ncbi:MULTISPECIES: nuclear transport factor 2 family protein [unclassified Streptomyces]|uniref:YybH family protein n=1 Tax=unclassified Streptomyces TaxID=2593676 RepID=UPI001BE82935|nr:MULTISPECIES: nuclear transport factor 2 family protein [unclassified Streptomyces]MBT2404772.1 nuclear transport factor 2 family protein [Streptomyces sp. ISL-21]MBT2455002.1 nuclear transport factor 2 family protein [Streptomyces sp. ISL-86]MBT2609075.1 nuclear transport factor 2 family protein [Streptomyces sp. ISL-87]